MNRILETKRLYLRELCMEDIAELSEVLSDAESMKYYDHPFSKDEVEKWIKWNIDNYKNHNFGLWAVMLKEGDIFIGDCGITIQEINNESLPEIGYHIKKEFWNKGFATEAAEGCKKYAFETLNLDTVFTYTTSSNFPSRRVAEKNGMVFIKKFKKALYGKDVEEVLYRASKGDESPEVIRGRAEKCVNMYVMKVMRQQFDECGQSLDAQYTKYGNTEFFFARIIEPGHIYELGYPRCFCPMVESGLVKSPAHCECSRQSILYVLQNLLPEKTIRVTTLGTVLSGEDKCTFRAEIHHTSTT